MANSEQYKNLINEIVQKQIIILGPDIVLLKAKAVSGLKLDSNGKVDSISGDPQVVLQNLVNEYMALSGHTMRNILQPIVSKYPDIKIDLD